jgi:energy-coupling factor transporter ATP-binding protein EcfA2
MNIKVNQNLLSIVPLKSQFSRSTRIDQDKLEDNSFIYSGSIDLFLNTLASHQESESPQGAFTWTGPYGSGKSTLALSLLSILTGDKRNRTKAANSYKQETAIRIWNAFPPKKAGWQAITVTGYNGGRRRGHSIKHY